MLKRREEKRTKMEGGKKEETKEEKMAGLKGRSRKGEMR